MAKKKQNFSSGSFRKKETKTSVDHQFYFGKENFRWMLIGLVLILAGYILMMGSSANTRPDDVVDPTYWNDRIFSVMRIRIAPFLVVTGFAVEAYAILRRSRKA